MLNLNFRSWDLNETYWGRFQVWKKIICASFRTNSTLYKCHLSLIVFKLRFNILKILDKTLLSLFYALLFQKKNYFMLFSNARHGYTEYFYISLLTKKQRYLKTVQIGNIFYSCAVFPFHPRTTNWAPSLENSRRTFSIKLTKAVEDLSLENSQM